MWTTGFLDGDDSDAQRRMDAWRRRQRPDNEVPVCVALNVVLAQTPDLVVYLGDVRAYRSVLDFQVTALARGQASGQRLSSGVFGHGEPADSLLLGVEFADGRTARTAGLGFGPGDADPDDATPMLVPSGGGGGSCVDLSVVLSPLPPPGPLRFVVASAGWGVPETVTEMDAEPLRAAAARARVVWEAEPFRPPAPPPPPPTTPGGWFDRAGR